jgi:hypothetical protein
MLPPTFNYGLYLICQKPAHDNVEVVQSVLDRNSTERLTALLGYESITQQFGLIALHPTES